jgi:multidrug transporter EmrE-like cation transporter
MILITISGILEGLGSIFYKNNSFIIGFILFLISIITWNFALKNNLIISSCFIAKIIELSIVSLAGVFIFKENLNTFQILGIILGFISIILLEQ